MKYEVIYRSYEGSHLKREEKKAVHLGQDDSFWFRGGRVRAKLEWNQQKQGMAGRILLNFLEDSEETIAVGIRVTVENWRKENYVLMPGAVYDGNRMESICYTYPPYHIVNRENAAQAAPVITDIPHFSVEEKKSLISFLSGDMSTPAVGYYDSREKKSFFLMGPHRAGERYTGFQAEENLDQEIAAFSLWAPGVRVDTKYFFGELSDGSGYYPDNHQASEDRGQYFGSGDTLELPFFMDYENATDIPEFFRNFNKIRLTMEHADTKPEVVPLSKAYQEIKEKYQRENFIVGPEEGEGYYTVGTNRSIPQQHWQAGWIGGGMNYLAFLQEDTGEAFNRSVASFRFILDHLMNEKGWVCGIYAEGKYYGDAFDQEKGGNILLIRKNADLLYFLLKELQLLKKKGLHRKTDGEKIERMADAFVRLFRKYGQVGQFIDIDREELLMGNTACGAITAGALSLAYEVFGKEEYLTTAKKLGELYYRDYASKGVLNGGPGEICQAPDSESAFALLESYVQLYETTGEQQWLSYAEDTFEVAITWVMSYDFCFPRESTAGKRGAHTLGTVFANAQNKHSAPGICTLSGNSMLKLYRFTGKEKYLDWVGAVAGALPQFVSRTDSRIPTLQKRDLPAGYMNERVQTSDWEGAQTVGEFLCGSNWPEVVMLLTYVEIPGIYIDFCGKVVRCFDHIRCESKFDGDEVKLTLYNPTEYSADVMVLSDFRTDRDKVTHNYFDSMTKVPVAAGETVEISISRN